MESVSHFFGNLYRRITGMHEDTDIPVYDFPDTIEGFGYHFNEEGRLVDRDGGPFNYQVAENREYNQQRYEALGELVTEYVYQKMETDLQLQKIFIPVDNVRKEEPQGFIFQSKDAGKQETLMVIIGGAGVVRAGQWSRKLIMNEDLEIGSQLPYIRRAIEAGYGVMVLNTNQNQQVINGRARNIRGSASAEEHGLYVWEHIISKTAAANIVIVAHSLGGIVTCTMAERFLEEFQKRVFCVVFTDSVHTANRQRWSQPVKQFLKERAVNFASAIVPIDYMMLSSHPDDCLSVSAGTAEHERTSHTCINTAFRLIHDNHASWTTDGTMAPRHFKPLPADLSEYRWEHLQKGGKVTSSSSAKEPSADLKKRSTEDKPGEESGFTEEEKCEVRPRDGGKNLISVVIDAEETQDDDTSVKHDKEHEEAGEKQVADSNSTRTEETESKTEDIENKAEASDQKTEDSGSVNQRDMDRDVVREEAVSGDTGVTRDSEEAVTKDTEATITRDIEASVLGNIAEAVSKHTEETVIENTQAVSRDIIGTVREDKEETITKDTEAAVIKNIEEVITRDRKEVVIGDMKVITKDTEEAVTRDTEEAVTRDTEEAITMDTEEAVIRDSEKAVTSDTEEAVTIDSAKAVTRDAEEAVTSDTKRAENTEGAVSENKEAAVIKDTEGAELSPGTVKSPSPGAQQSDICLT